MPAAEHTHSPTPEEIMEYVDGEGTAASRDAIAAHLVTCGTCRAIAADQRDLSEAARAWTVDAAPASLQPPTAGNANILRPRVRAWYRSPLVLAGLSAAAIVLLVAIPIRGRKSLSEVQNIAFQSEAGRRTMVQGRGGVGGGTTRDLPAMAAPEMQSAAAPRTPAVIRTATLRIVVKEFDGVRTTVEGIVSQSDGFIDHMTITGDKTTARELRGTVRVPGDRMAAALARLRQIGQAVEDTQGSQDVTDHIVDLDARLASARATEQRLKELIRTRTGKLSDVLEVERELTRVRLDIERLDAEKTNVGRRVSYATIDVTISEERKAGLDAGPLPIATRIRIAAADGLSAALESLALTLLFVLRAGPALVIWGMAAGLIWVFGRRFLKPSA
jgi:anti-sigma factor RsiW